MLRPLNDRVRFYKILDRLQLRQHGPRTLSQCSAGKEFPLKGVYFFFEPGEVRSDTGNGLRVVRVGSQAVSRGAKGTLWQRLSHHRGSASGLGGNHRSSVFRLLVGEAIGVKIPSLAVHSWSQRPPVSASVRVAERELEEAVSDYIRTMPFLYLAVDDEPSSRSMRAYLERNSIALLSNISGAAHEKLDQPSETWLGHYCPRPRVRGSGLWNRRHVHDSYDPEFLDRLDELV